MVILPPPFTAPRRRPSPTSGFIPSIDVTHKCGPFSSPRRLWTLTNVSGNVRELGPPPREYGRQ